MTHGQTEGRKQKHFFFCDAKLLIFKHNEDGKEKSPSTKWGIISASNFQWGWSSHSGARRIKGKKFRRRLRVPRHPRAFGSSRENEKMLGSSCWALRSLQEIGGSAAWVRRWVNVHFSLPSVKSRFHICSWPGGHEEADRGPFGNSKRHQRRMMDSVLTGSGFVLLLLLVFYRWNDNKNLMAG